MPLDMATIVARCDVCGDISARIVLKPLPDRGFWNEETVEPALKRAGWNIEGERTICPACVENEREKAENAELARLSGEHDADALAALKAGLG